MFCGWGSCGLRHCAGCVPGMVGLFWEAVPILSIAPFEEAPKKEQIKMARGRLGLKFSDLSHRLSDGDSTEGVSGQGSRRTASAACAVRRKTDMQSRGKLVGSSWGNEHSSAPSFCFATFASRDSLVAFTEGERVYCVVSEWAGMGSAVTRQGL